MADFNYDDLTEQSAMGWQRFCRGAMVSSIIAIVTFAVVISLTT